MIRWIVILAPGLYAVVAMAQRLPVVFIPEQLRFTAMRDDVVHVSRLHVAPLFHALYTQWVGIQIPLPGFLPFAAIAASRRAPVIFRMLELMPFTVFRPIWDKRGAAGMSAWCVWTVWHMCNLLSEGELIFSVSRLQNQLPSYTVVGEAICQGCLQFYYFSHGSPTFPKCP